MNPTTLLSGLGAAITADPALGGASSTGRDSNPGSGDLFLALVNGLLQGGDQADLGATPGPVAEPGPTPGEIAPPVVPPVLTTGPATDPATVAETQAETDAETDPATDLATDLSMLPVALTLTPVVVQPAVTEQGDAAPTGSSVDTTAGPADIAVSAPSTGGSPQAGTDTGADQPRDGGPADQPAAVAPSAPRVEVRPDAVQAQPTGVPAAVGVAPTTAPTAVAVPATSADLPRVADQVFPEVLRATGNADNGTSRVTVKLNPESLGEVRVVLTQRRGELEVTLAGGADARRALTEGAPELRRLLESVGRADSRIFIRDLPTGSALPSSAAPVPASSGQTTRTDVSTDLAGGAWSGAGRPGGDSAPDRDSSRRHPGSTTATDGIPSVTIPSRPIQTAGRTHAGLDLSM